MRTPKTDRKVRVVGEKGSEQNQLRGELYEYCIDRLNVALDEDCFFEVIALCDMMITDRIEAYTQYLLHDDENHQKTGSIGLSVAAMGAARSDKDISIDAEYQALYTRIEQFAGARNEIMHGFVLVKNETKDAPLEQREEFAQFMAEFGAKLLIDVMSWTRKQIKVTI